MTEALPMSSITISCIAEALCDALTHARVGNFYHAGTTIGMVRSLRDGMTNTEERGRATTLIDHVSTYIYCSQPDERRRTDRPRVTPADRSVLERVRDQRVAAEDERALKRLEGRRLVKSRNGAWVLRSRGKRALGGMP